MSKRTTRKPVSKSQFIRDRAGQPPATIIQEARLKGIQISRGLVHTVRSQDRMRAKAAQPGAEVQQMVTTKMVKAVAKAPGKSTSLVRVGAITLTIDGVQMSVRANSKAEACLLFAKAVLGDQVCRTILDSDTQSRSIQL